MTSPRYSLPAIALHWGQAILVFWLLWLGWTMTDLPKGAERSAAYGLHKSLGLLMLFIVAIRLVWRQRKAPPPMLVGGREAKLAHLVHIALYGFLILAPLAGYLASSFTPYALKFFGIEIPKAGWPDESFNAFFKQCHLWAVWGGAGLIFLHVAGAIKHLLKRDGSIQRMLPGKLFKK